MPTIQNWKNELDKWNLWHKADGKNYSFVTCDKDIEKFIENLLIQVIDEFPDNMEFKLEDGSFWYGHQLKKQLKERYL